MIGAWALAIAFQLGAAGNSGEGGPDAADSPSATAAPAPAGKVPRRDLLSVGAAVVPGLILHGSGHFAGGDRRTAWRLLAVQSAGIGGMVAGFAGLALTGASRRVVGAMVVTSIAGAGLLLGSGLADLYGVLAPAGGVGAALPFAPTVEAGLGFRYVRNPTFEYRWLGGSQVDWRWRRLRLGGEIWSAGGGGVLRAGGVVGWRLFGPRPASGGSPALPTGSFLDFSATFVHHRERSPVVPFQISTGGLRADGRHDLAGFAASMAGSFLEWGLGLSIAAHHYGGPADVTDANDALIARLAYGVYIGRGVAPRAEVVIFYDHAHDDLAGGLKMPGLGSGPLGYFGLGATIYLSEHWGVRAEAQAGSAHVLGLRLTYRYGRLSGT